METRGLTRIIKSGGKNSAPSFPLFCMVGLGLNIDNSGHRGKSKIKALFFWTEFMKIQFSRVQTNSIQFIYVLENSIQFSYFPLIV